MSSYTGAIKAAQLGQQRGMKGSAANPNSAYPWRVENYQTAGAKWQNPKNYTKMLRSYASQGLQQYSWHPSAFTPEMEKDTVQQYINTSNAQADKANDQFKTNMARTGISGQPVTASHAAQLGYERGKDVANKSTDVHNQFAVQRQEDWEDWLNFLRMENNQDRQFKLGRDQMAMQMAQFNAARGDRNKQSTLQRIMPWASMAMGGLGTLLGDHPGENNG